MRATGQRNDLIGALECEFVTLFRATRRLGQQVGREVHPDLDLNAYLPPRLNHALDPSRIRTVDVCCV